MPEQTNVFTPQQWRAMTAPGVYRSGQFPVVWAGEQLRHWKQNVIDHQQQQIAKSYQQTHLWAAPGDPPLRNPFALPRQSDHFFRTPTPGVPSEPCIYFVIDQAAPLILYIGETANLHQRWQGQHDCKTYLSHYLDAHRRHQWPTQIHWVFDWQVPQTTRLRRQWERAWIRHWLPPFNQESWGRWGAPWRIRYQVAE